MIEAIKAQMKKELDDEYEKYKQEQLKKLDLELELKRNKIISEILDSISIVMETNINNCEPIINIRIDRKVKYEKVSVENILKSQIDAKLQELYENLDRLKDCQKKVLGYGGDDLSIRDEIAEVEDLIHSYEEMMDNDQ